MAGGLSILRVSGTDIVDKSGRKVWLRGVSLGGWLMMEGYMTGGRDIPESRIKADFERVLGSDALADFVRSYRDAFITEDDIETIKRWGANCIRVPFNYRLIEHEDRPFSLNDEGLGYLDKVIEWCDRHDIYCILDMHAAPGSQNHDWHSDCNGAPDLFYNEFNKDRYLRLWYFLADRYRDSSAIAAYDILNEPVVPLSDEWRVKDLYEKATKEIRSAGDRHIIFLEGNVWAQRLDFLGKPSDDNTAYSIHAYPPTDFTFNFVQGQRYPGKSQGLMWDKSKFEILAKPYRIFADLVKVPLYVGEFGVNARDGLYGEVEWVRDVVDVFKRNYLHWTYWTYKTVANYIYPDGLYRYVNNPPWVNRAGPVSGWETFAGLWKKDRNRIVSSWRTENFQLNEKILAVLKAGW
jgi:hypothetical protein